MARSLYRLPIHKIRHKIVTIINISNQLNALLSDGIKNEISPRSKTISAPLYFIIPMVN
jgi:hypothetical protein